jgi:hypothetical protein
VARIRPRAAAMKTTREARPQRKFAAGASGPTARETLPTHGTPHRDSRVAPMMMMTNKAHELRRPQCHHRQVVCSL